MAARSTRRRAEKSSPAVPEQNDSPAIPQTPGPLEDSGQSGLTAMAEQSVPVEPVETSSPAPAEPSPENNPAEPGAVPESDRGFASKTVLIPYMLLMLRDSVLHGYAIWEKLTLMGIPGLTDSDRASIYRVLRQLERDGKIQSEWDTASDGPARRVYRLTDAGESFLKVWAVGLDQYRQSLDFFFKLYAGSLPPNPFGFNFQAPARSNNPQNPKEGNK